MVKTRFNLAQDRFNTNLEVENNAELGAAASDKAKADIPWKGVPAFLTYDWTGEKFVHPPGWE